MHRLEQTINATECDLVLSATPIDLRGITDIRVGSTADVMSSR